MFCNPIGLTVDMSGLTIEVRTNETELIPSIQEAKPVFINYNLNFTAVV